MESLPTCLQYSVSFAANSSNKIMEQQAKATLIQQRKVLEEKKGASAATASIGSGGGSAGSAPSADNERTDGSSSALLVGGVIAAGAVLALGIFAGGDKVQDISTDGRSGSKATGMYHAHVHRADVTATERTRKQSPHCCSQLLSRDSITLSLSNKIDCAETIEGKKSAAAIAPLPAAPPPQGNVPPEPKPKPGPPPQGNVPPDPKAKPAGPPPKGNVDTAPSGLAAPTAAAPSISAEDLKKAEAARQDEERKAAQQQV